MNAKEISEIFKNWATTTTLVGAFIFTILKGSPYIEEKKKEVALNNKIIEVETKIANIKIKEIDDINSTILAKKAHYESELSKPRSERNNSLIDKLHNELKYENAKKYKELEEIKNLLEEK